MKANEAPEKVYLLFNRPYLVDYSKLNKRRCKEEVEYVRLDAFIEKACEFLRTHSEVDYFELIPDANYCGAGNLNKKKMIEDFKKYMKEE